MDIEIDIECVIFINTEVSLNTLENVVSQILSGKIQYDTIKTDWSEIDILKNDDFDEAKLKDSSTGFLYYRYRLELYPVGNFSREICIENVSLLLRNIWSRGWKAVTACDYEDELPRKGGYQADGP